LDRGGDGGEAGEERGGCQAKEGDSEVHGLRPATVRGLGFII
jgi:hypothetical protein